MSSDEPRSPQSAWMRWAMLAVGAIAVIVVAALIWRAGSGPSVGGEPGGGSTATGAIPTQTDAPVPLPSVPSSTVTGSPSAVAPEPEVTVTAKVNKPIEPEPGLTARVSRIEAVKGDAHGPGEIAGPALRVTLRLDNESQSRIVAESIVVNLYYGAKNHPAGPLSGPGLKPFTGVIDKGQKSSGSYVFSVPVDQRRKVRIEFRYSTEAPVTIFEGAA